MATYEELYILLIIFSKKGGIKGGGGGRKTYFFLRHSRYFFCLHAHLERDFFFNFFKHKYFVLCFVWRNRTCFFAFFAKYRSPDNIVV